MVPRSCSARFDLQLRDVAVDGVRWASFSAIVARAISMAVLLVLARLVAPEAFGVFAAYLAIIKIVEAVVGLGLDHAVVQRSALRDGAVAAVQRLQVSVSAAAAVGLAAISWPIAQVVTGGERPEVLVALASTVLFHGAGLAATASLRRELDFARLARATMLGVAVGAAVGLLAGISGLGVWALVAMEGARVVVTTVAVRRAAAVRVGGTADRGVLQDLWAFARSTLATDVIAVLLRRTDDLLVGAFLGPAALGAYAMAYNVLQVSTEFLARTPANVALPILSGIQEDRRRVVQAFLRGEQLVATVALPAYVGLAMLAQDLVLAVLGPEWVAAGPVLRLLAGVGAIHALLLLNSSLLLAVGRADVRLRLAMLDFAIGIPAFVIGVSFGIEGVAAAYLVANVVTTPVEAGAAVRFAGVPAGGYARAVGRPLLVAAMVAACLVATAPLTSTPVAATLVGGVTSAGAWIVGVRLLLPEVWTTLVKAGRRRSAT